jgi:hypothetical protein
LRQEPMPTPLLFRRIRTWLWRRSLMARSSTCSIRIGGRPPEKASANFSRISSHRDTGRLAGANTTRRCPIRPLRSGCQSPNRLTFLSQEIPYRAPLHSQNGLCLFNLSCFLHFSASLPSAISLTLILDHPCRSLVPRAGCDLCSGHPPHGIQTSLLFSCQKKKKKKKNLFLVPCCTLR